MRLRDFLSFFRGGSSSAPSGLRNKPGGMAFINASVDEEVLVNRVVRTVRLNGRGLWEIDPPQRFVSTAETFYTSNSYLSKIGEHLVAVAIGDECLTPINGDGISHEEVRELFAPRLRQGEKAHV